MGGPNAGHSKKFSEAELLKGHMRVSRFVFFHLALLALSVGAHAQNPVRPSTPADYAGAEAEHSDIIQAKGKSMRTLPAQPDGSKGYMTSLGSSEPGYGPVDKTFRRSEDASLYRALCNGTDSIILGKVTASESKFSKGEQTILTRYEFQVDSVLHDTGRVTIPKYIHIANLGGTLIGSDGITYWVKVQGGFKFAVGSLYLLILRHGDGAPPDVFMHPEGLGIQVKNGRLYPSTGGLSMMVSGEPLSELKSRFNHLLAQHPCK